MGKSQHIIIHPEKMYFKSGNEIMVSQEGKMLKKNRY